MPIEPLHYFNPYPPLFFVLKIMSAVTSAAYIQEHFRQDFFMEANNMNPDQTAMNLGLYCLQYRLPININI